MSNTPDEPEREESSAYPEPFLRAFEEAVGRLGWQVRRWLSDGVDCLDEAGAEATFGLDNLFRRARGIAPSDWADFIAEHLAHVRQALKTSKVGDDLAEVADRLLVRVGQPFGAGRAGAMVWSRPLDDTGLIVSLVIDHEETMSFVPEEKVRESGQSGEFWLERALENLRQRTSPDLLEAIDEETGILLCCTGDAYDAARALVVEYLLPEYAEHGYLLTTPNRDRLLVLPVRPEAIPRLHLLRLIARQSYQEAPYPISDEVFWVRGDVWRRFPIEIKDKTLTVTPPPEFIEVLGSLMPDEEGEFEEDEEE
jgi:hypothetical protein